jgi:transcriptional regulator with XRE-family HTH domain
LSIVPIFDLEDESCERASQRRVLRLKTRGVTGDGKERPVVIRNISTGGLLLEADLAISPGEFVVIELPEVGAIPAQVVWRSDKLCGCSFDKKLSAAGLTAARLQGLPVNHFSTSSEASLENRGFGPQLRHLRHAAGLTLADVAAATNVSKPTVWAWEKGKARPAPHRIAAIAEVLGVEPAALQDSPPQGSVTGSLTVVGECRNLIAQVFGTTPDSVRIMVEL